MLVSLWIRPLLPRLPRHPQLPSSALHNVSDPNRRWATRTTGKARAKAHERRHHRIHAELVRVYTQSKTRNSITFPNQSSAAFACEDIHLDRVLQQKCSRSRPCPTASGVLAVATGPSVEERERERIWFLLLHNQHHLFPTSNFTFPLIRLTAKKATVVWVSCMHYY